MRVLVLVAAFARDAEPRLRAALDEARTDEWTRVDVASPAPRSVPPRPDMTRWDQWKHLLAHERALALHNREEEACAQTRAIVRAYAGAEAGEETPHTAIPALIEACDLLVVLATPDYERRMAASERYATKIGKRVARRVMRA